MVTISVCMIVKNEEAVLERCLASLQGIAEEIIIVDTGSTDRTKEIAARYTDKIYDFTWIHDFSAARNFAFSKASMDYIYSADADEVIEETDRRKFLTLKQVLLPEVEIVEMIYVNPEDCNMVYNFTKEPRPKLFKRLREFRWIDPIHETIALDPVVYSSDIEIMHLPEQMHSSRDFQAMERELKKNGRLSARLYSMYAKELFISGTKEDFVTAMPWFQKRLLQSEISEDAKAEAVCVLAKTCALLQDWEQLLSLGLMEIATNKTPAAELFFLLGEYYETAGQEAEAVFWYRKAALEAECYVCIFYGGEYALQHVIRLLKKQGGLEEAAQYESLLGQER
ncbi:MAG: glycosyltransferase [Lachnospiraceae bacterium]|nr:glycosyltransferase [Lachnospiraceae bacterium]